MSANFEVKYVDNIILLCVFTLTTKTLLKTSWQADLMSYALIFTDTYVCKTLVNGVFESVN